MDGSKRLRELPTSAIGEQRDVEAMIGSPYRTAWGWERSREPRAGRRAANHESRPPGVGRLGQESNGLAADTTAQQYRSCKQLRSLDSISFR